MVQCHLKMCAAFRQKSHRDLKQKINKAKRSFFQSLENPQISNKKFCVLLICGQWNYHVACQMAAHLLLLIKISTLSQPSKVTQLLSYRPQIVRFALWLFWLHSWKSVSCAEKFICFSLQETNGLSAMCPLVRGFTVNPNISKLNFFYTDILAYPLLSCSLTSPWTASDNDPDPITAVTNCGCLGVRMDTHVYVPLSIDELRGENTNCLKKSLPVCLCWFETVTRPLIPVNAAPSLVNMLLTVTSLSVTPPSRSIAQFRVTLLPA